MIDGGKISKSEGNAVDPLNLIDKYGANAFRYFILADMTAGQDATFSEERFIERYNSGLANNFGNCANRVIKLIESACEGKIPASGNGDVIDENLRDEITRIAAHIEDDINDLRIDTVVTKALKGFSLINQYLEKTEPWKLKKSPQNRGRLEEVLGNAVEALRIVSGLLYPIIPEKINYLRRCIGISYESGIPTYQKLSSWGASLAGKKAEISDALFPRI